MSQEDYIKSVAITGQDITDIQIKSWYANYRREDFNLVRNTAAIHELCSFTGEGEYLGGVCSVQDAGLVAKPISAVLLTLDTVTIYSLGSIELYTNSINTNNSLIVSLYDNGKGTQIIKLTGKRYFKYHMALYVQQDVVTNVTYQGGINYGR